MEKERTCARGSCDNKFAPTRPAHIYCSKRCKEKAQDKKRIRRRLNEGNLESAIVRKHIARSVKDPVEREGVPFGVEQILPGSFESGKRR